MDRKLPIAAVTPVARLRLLKVNPVWVITIEPGRVKVGIPEIRLEVIVALVTVAIVAAPGVNMTLLMCNVNASPTDMFTLPTARLNAPTPMVEVNWGMLTFWRTPLTISCFITTFCSPVEVSITGVLSNTSKEPLTLLKLRFRPLTFGKS